MITLIRMIVIKVIKTKWQCAFWVEFNKRANELIKNPEAIEQKLLPYIVNAIHKSIPTEDLKDIANEYMVKRQD